jgi:hypothetical protein
MTIADHPLHGSGRAALPHPALALGNERKALGRPGMADARGRQPAHVAVRLLRPPSVDPEVEYVVKVEVRQERAADAPYAKGNFQFERLITGWRDRPALDLRRK